MGQTILARVRGPAGATGAAGATGPPGIPGTWTLLGSDQLTLNPDIAVDVKSSSIPFGAPGTPRPYQFPFYLVKAGAIGIEPVLVVQTPPPDPTVGVAWTGAVVYAWIESKANGPQVDLTFWAKLQGTANAISIHWCIMMGEFS